MDKDGYRYQGIMWMDVSERNHTGSFYDDARYATTGFQIRNDFRRDDPIHHDEENGFLAFARIVHHGLSD